MSVDPPEEPRFDTRGLPEGYDPHKLYEYRYNKRVKEASGFEYYLYKYIPYQVIRSFAFAIDPLSQVKMSLGVITPANRHRVRAMESVLINQHILIYNEQENWSQASIPNYNGIVGLVGPLGERTYARGSSVGDSNYWQPVLPSYSDDTTDRTRLFGSTQGELKQFQHYLNSPPRYISERIDVDSYFDKPTNPPPKPYFASINRGAELHTIRIAPYGAALGTESFRLLKLREEEVVTALMQKHVLAMFKDANPEHRTYSLARNIFELRDVPHSALQLKRSIENLIKLSDSLQIPSRMHKLLHNSKASIKDIPKEYLSYHFGWKQTYKDIMDLMAAPSKVTKQINLLLARNGKPSTYRVKREFPSRDVGAPDFSYITTGMDRNLKIESTIDRSVELRLVLNQTFTFPPAAEIQFAKELAIDKMGLYPKFIDMYNIVPWTWLVDWYTGLGNYLEIIENIAKDRALINWGMLTGKSTGTLTTHLRSNQVDIKRSGYNLNPGEPPHEEVIVREHNHESKCHYTFQLRKDLAGILDVGITTDETTLSLYQKSILGAILATRLDFSRPFRIPR